MQVTSLLSQHDHEHCEGCGHDHSHSNVGLTWMLFGLVFVLNAFVVDWVFESAHVVASASAMIGAIVLAKREIGEQDNPSPMVRTKAAE